MSLGRLWWQEAYHREREASSSSPKGREHRHKAELPSKAQMQAKLDSLTRINEDLTRRLEYKNISFGPSPRIRRRAL